MQRDRHEIRANLFLRSWKISLLFFCLLFIHVVRCRSLFPFFINPFQLRYALFWSAIHNFCSTQCIIYGTCCCWPAAFFFFSPRTKRHNNWTIVIKFMQMLTGLFDGFLGSIYSVLISIQTNVFFLLIQEQKTKVTHIHNLLVELLPFFFLK